MTSKKLIRFLTIIAIIGMGLLFLNNNFVNASIRFENFDINKFSTTTTVDQDLVNQIQAFAFRTINEFETCKGRSENQFQASWCGNIYEADRIRLSYLLAINANFNQSIVKQDNHIRKLVFNKNNSLRTEYQSESGNASTMISHTDLDENFTSGEYPIKLPFKDFYPHGTTEDHYFGKATQQALKSCALGEGSHSRTRLKILNPNISNEQQTEEQSSGQQVENISEFPKIGCNDLKLVLEQFFNENNIKLLLQNTSPLPPWLKFNQEERVYFELSDEEKNQANNRELSDDDYKDIKSQCYFRGLQAILICPAVRTMSGLSDAGMNMIDKYFTLKTKFTNQRSVGGQVLYRSWINTRNIANIFLIISVLIIVIAYLLNSQNNNYRLSTFLPKLIVIVIIMNASFFLMQIAVDISNIVGSGIYTLFNNTGEGIFSISDLATQILSGAAITTISSIFIVSVGGAGITVMFFILLFIPVVIAVTISIILIIVTLSVRDALFIMCMLTMPIAITSLLLPKTSRFFAVWKKTIISVLMIPITTGLLFGAGKLTSTIMLSMGGFFPFFALIPLAIQFTLLPMVILNSIKNLPLVGNKIATTVGGLAGKATNKYHESDFNKQFNQNASRQFKTFMSSSAYKKGAKRWPYQLRLMKSKIIDPAVSNYSLLSKVSDFDKETYDDILQKTNILSPQIAAAVLYEKGIFKRKPDYENSFKSDEIDFIKTTAQNSDPNYIMASLLKLSDDGEGDYKTITKGIDEFIQKGGNHAVAVEFLRTIKSNYEKESRYSTSAILGGILEAHKEGTGPKSTEDGTLDKRYYDEAIDGGNGPSASLGSTVASEITNGHDSEKIISLTVNQLIHNSNWSKFKGFGNNSVEHKALERIITSDREVGKKLITNIKSAAGQNENAINYLKKFNKYF